MLTFWNAWVLCEFFRINLPPPTHQHGAGGKHLGKHLVIAKQVKHNRSLQKREYHLQAPCLKHYTKKRFPANTQHRVNTYAKGITRVLLFIRLIKGCSLRTGLLSFLSNSKSGLLRSIHKDEEFSNACT
jgi:hypothetical protein